MSADWKERAAECRRKAQEVIEASANEATEQIKVEFVRVATELLKLAGAIEEELASAGPSQSGRQPLPSHQA